MDDDNVHFFKDSTESFGYSSKGFIYDRFYHRSINEGVDLISESRFFILKFVGDIILCKKVRIGV